MRRIYFPVPDVAVTEKIVDDLLLATMLAGAGVGSWLGGMVGMSVGNRRTKEFEDAIEAGELLVLADVPADRVAEIETRVKQHLPQVEVEQTEPRVPAFP